MYGQFNEVKIIKRIYEKYYFPKTCIEFGAYDGITNANTFYFWKKKVFSKRNTYPESYPPYQNKFQKNNFFLIFFTFLLAKNT